MRLLVASGGMAGPGPSTPLVAVEPAGDVRASFLADAVADGGGKVVPAAEAEALVWTDPGRADGLADLLAANPGLRWIQLPWAGIEPQVEVVRSFPERIWTCGKGVYAEPVAEHALALALAGRRRLDRFAKARTWTRPQGEYLLGSRVTIVGGGGIAESLLRLLGPFGCRVTVVRSTPQLMAGAAEVVGDDQLDEALTGADVVVLALPLTPGTAGLIDRRRLDLVAPGAVLVNVARGQLVVTDDLVAALDHGPLAGAGLDVTDPEPLPDGHPLWDRPDVLISPHTANTPAMARPLLAARVADNVRRYAAGEPLVGPVDPAKGY
jgi:phosphoglycerate dehydrogenase-like enzyme